MCIRDRTLPSWLNQEKVIIIRHSQIMPDHKSTYNSHAIEACLENIPNISKIFVYLNDDIWMLGNWNMRDFISHNDNNDKNNDKNNNNDKIVFYVDNYEKGRNVTSSSGSHEYAWRNIHQLLEKMELSSADAYRPALSHAPYVGHKQSDLYVSEEIEKTKLSKFRSAEDIGVMCGFHQYYQYYKGHAIARKINTICLTYKDLIGNNGSIPATARVLTLQDDFINDPSEKDIHRTKKILNCIFPIRSPYEYSPINTLQ